jgi:hypothetical protein
MKDKVAYMKILRYINKALVINLDTVLNKIEKL